MTEAPVPRRVSPFVAARVATSWLTVLPVRAHEITIDRRVGAAVMTAVPAVGALLGVFAAGMAAALSRTSLPDAMIGVLVVVALALGTRGMHIDGLADTADGLGCYGPPDRVATVMRSGSVGPFGVAAVVGTGAVQAVGFTTLTAHSAWYAIGFAVFTGRVGAVVGTRRGLPPARGDGFGALVAGTQSRSIAVWTTIALAGGVLLGFTSGTAGSGFDIAAAGRGGLVALVVIALAWAFTRHCARRVGGIPGDVLGATIELVTAGTLIGLLV